MARAITANCDRGAAVRRMFPPFPTTKTAEGRSALSNRRYDPDRPIAIDVSCSLPCLLSFRRPHRCCLFAAFQLPMGTM